MKNNEFDNIEIPDNVELFIKEGLNNAVLDKKKRKNKIVKFISCASIVAVVFAGFGLNSIADRIPFLNDVFKEIKNSKYSETIPISFNEYIDKYGQPINQTVTSNGITVTAEKAICDGSNLFVSYIIKKDGKFEMDEYSTQLLINETNTVDFKLNSKLYSTGSLEGTLVDEHTFVGAQIFYLDYLTNDFADEFTLRTSFNNIDFVKGDGWNFEFPVKVSSEANNKIDVNETADLYTTHAIYNNAFSLDIEYTIPKDKEKDENGITTFYDISVYDDKGNFLAPRQGDYLYDEGADKERRLVRLEPVNKDCEYIEIIYNKGEYVDDKKHPGAYEEYGNNKLNDFKLKINIK